MPRQMMHGDEVVQSGFATAEGWMGKLFPWTTSRSTSPALPPGDYTFVASTDDPSGGPRATAPTDTKDFTVP